MTNFNAVLSGNTIDLTLLVSTFTRIRQESETLCQPLEIDDYQIQSIEQTSPPKWHLAHTSWFYEAFVLTYFKPDYRVFNSKFDYIFNSYYYRHNDMHARVNRGLLSRPTVKEIYAYRQYVDQQVLALFDEIDASKKEELSFRINLGLNHEQQHQELLLMDIKHNFFTNPLKPAYRTNLEIPDGTIRPINWKDHQGGMEKTGYSEQSFSFDNETPEYTCIIQPHQLADRFISNGEYLEFIEDNAYQNPALWLSDGWALINKNHWQSPLYWQKNDSQWRQFSLGGDRPLNIHEPVCHLSYYEADAYARWAGHRLPTEAELETRLKQQSVTGNFINTDLLHPTPATEQGQWFGDLWAWTASPYSAYPGFKASTGIIGEYNGKFMSNQMVLKGGSCVTAAGHSRPSYRNFFYPHERWAFTGLRLAKDF